LGLEDTKHKLEEASFFLGKVKSCLDDPIGLSYYLSAFVSAGRSVTWVMQSEFGKNQEHKEWYEMKMKDMTEDNILDFFNSVRIITIHQEGKVRFRRKISVYVIEPPPIEQPTPSREIELFLENAPEKNGIKLCNQYLQKLSDLVTDAEKMINGF
jgi:hypothetical protein